MICIYVYKYEENIAQNCDQKCATAYIYFKVKTKILNIDNHIKFIALNTQKAEINHLLNPFFRCDLKNVKKSLA